ncbi:MAG: ribonuclease R, partial [Traorella sp.]
MFDLTNATEFTAFMKAYNEGIQDYTFIEIKEKIYLASKKGYFTGTIKINPKGFGFVENDEIHCYVSNTKKCMNNDEVLAHFINDENEPSECEIIQVIKRNLTHLVGTVKKKDSRSPKFLPDSPLISQDIKIKNWNDFKLVHDSKVLVKITKYEPLQGIIEKVVGYKYDPGVDITSVLLEHEVNLEFNEAVQKEINKIPDVVTKKDRQGRIDLTDQLIITIDGDDSRDFDDAISIEQIEDGYQLGVHIADVSHYVKEKSALDKEAYERGTSIYVCDRVVPMLPQYLSNGICSLNPHVDRCAISCVMDINSKGEVMQYQIFPSIIRSKERMTYTNVNKIIHKDHEMCQKYDYLIDMIQMMLRLSNWIRKRREALGNIDFDTNEGKVILDAKGRAIDVQLRQRGESEKIIEDFMICANEVVANHMKWLEIPSLYRVHEQPDPKKMREFVHIAQLNGLKFKGNVLNVYPKQCQKLLNEAKKKPEYSVISTSLLRCMAKAKYDPKCLGHFGLGLQEYCHFTSPIRRYPDLVVHRMLRKYCFTQQENEKEMHKDEAFVEKAALKSSEQERKAIECERDVDDMKKAEYMEKYIGENFIGMISSVTKFGFFVELENTVEGLVHVSTLNDDHYVYDEQTLSLLGVRTQKRFTMGQKVKVKCVGASRFKKQVDFELVGGKYEKN